MTWIGLSLLANIGFTASSKGEIPKEVLFGNPEKTSPKLSPDGTKLAYLAPDSKNVLNVWVRDLKGGKEDKLVTSDKKRGILFFTWEYSNDNILYVQDRDGDENWHLYQTNINTKLTRDLTPFEGATAAVLAYESEFPKEMLLTLNIRNPSLFDVYRLNLQNGALEMEVENQKEVISWVADSKLQVKALAFYDAKGGTVVQVRDSLKDPWKDFMQWNAEDQGSILGFSPDHQSLYITSNVGEETEKLFQVNLQTKEKKLLAGDAKYDLSGIVLEHPTTHELEAVGVQRERFEWIAIDPKIKQDLAALQSRNDDFRVISRDLKNEYWVIMTSADNHPNHFSLYNRTTKEKQFLFSENPQIEKYTLSKMHPISFTAKDGMLLHGYLTLPQNKKAKNLPTVLMVHGGPWVRDTWGYSSYVQWLASQGYAVLQINYRGSTGYGKAYLNAGNKEWAGKMHTDLLDGKAWMIDQGYTDPRKVAIFGGSYGGYATLVGLAFTPDAFCCGVDIVGPSNLVTLLETVPPYWGPMKSIFTIRLGSLETDKAFLESISPLFKANQIIRPLLIAQGANDPRVKQAESDQIVEVMRKEGKPVEYLLFPDEGHGFKRPENKIKFISAAEEFLDKYLKNAN